MDVHVVRPGCALALSGRLGAATVADVRAALTEAVDNGVGVSSALLVDERLDAATPFAGSLTVRRLFPHSSLIAEPGGATHADSLFGDRCVDNLIASYLATGKRPTRQRWNGPDYLCRPLPDPVPPRASAAHRSTLSGDLLARRVEDTLAR